MNTVLLSYLSEEAGGHLAFLSFMSHTLQPCAVQPVRRSLKAVRYSSQGPKCAVSKVLIAACKVLIADPELRSP